MNCDQFDDAVLDLLDDDERRGDARAGDEARRHAEGCARCTVRYASLKRTLEAVRPPALALPEGLEARILAAARVHEAAQKPSLWQRIDRAISLAGAYAMRPQLAMGLLLCLMVGTSLVFLRARPNAKNIYVSEHGTPVEDGRADQTSDASVASAAPVAEHRAPEARAQGAARRGDDDRPGARGDKGGADSSRDGRVALGEASPYENTPSAGAVAGLGSPAVAAAPAAAPAQTATTTSNAATVGAASASPGADAAFSAATDDFNAKRFAEALRGFDAIANGGGPQAPRAALFAARSSRFGSGCGAAVGRFDAVASLYAGTTTAAEAMWDSAQCYREMGQYDRARQFFQALRRVAGYRDRAEQELAALDQRSDAGAGVASRAARSRPAAAPPALARPASSTR